MSILRSACLSVLCVMGFALPSHAVSFSATAFGDWSGVTLFGPSLGQVVAPIPIGGNPLAALSVSTLTPDTTYTGLISGGLTYDFSAGGVASIDVSLQYNPVLAFGDGHGVLPLLIEQSGNYYGAGLATTGSTVGWNTVSLSGLTTADFQLFDGLGTGVPGGPDFSAGADAMTFGFITFDSAGTGNTAFYDNFAVTVNTAPVPVPAALPLLATAMGALALHGRRRRCAVV